MHGSQRTTPTILSYHPLPVCLRHGLALILELVFHLDWLVSKSFLYYSLLSVLGIQVCLAISGFLHEYWGSDLGPDAHPLSHFPSPN